MGMLILLLEDLFPFLVIMFSLTMVYKSLPLKKILHNMVGSSNNGLELFKQMVRDSTLDSCV